MSLLIAAKVKANMCFSSNLTLYGSYYLCATVQTYATFTTITTIITIRLLFLSAYNLFVSANLYLLDLHNLQTQNLS